MRAKLNIEKDWTYRLGYQKCSMCKDYKGLECFNIDNSRVRGLSYMCRECLRSYQNGWCKENKEQIKVKGREYRLTHKEQEIARGKKYRSNNLDKIVLKSKIYYEKNKELISKQGKEYEAGQANYATFCRRLPVTDKPISGKNGKLKVKCIHCGNFFYPTVASVRGRVKAFAGKALGEYNFYCSDKCKHSCKLYGFHPAQQTDPDSLLFIQTPDRQRTRACQTNHLKQLQLDKIGYNYCEKCSKKVDTVELHHTLEVAKYGLKAINSSGHILLCKECHLEFTKKCRGSI